jgi:hypothetical protein
MLNLMSINLLATMKLNSQGDAKGTIGVFITAKHPAFTDELIDLFIQEIEKS